MYNYAALWVGMSVCIPTYMLASGLIAGGMDSWQALGTILLGNMIVLVPMLLNAHAGARYGIPFPVLVRASFGVRGANVAAILRAIVACRLVRHSDMDWRASDPHHARNCPARAGTLGGDAMGLFSAVLGHQHVRGLAWPRCHPVARRRVSPFLLVSGLFLVWWVSRLAGGWGPIWNTPSRFQTASDFLHFFIPALTGMVGFWATIALNIPDFTRYARSQRAQVLGQVLGLPTTMTLFSFIGIAVTSASVVIFGGRLGSGGAARKIESAGRGGNRARRSSVRDAHHERRSERRLARKRLL